MALTFRDKAYIDGEILDLRRAILNLHTKAEIESEENEEAESLSDRLSRLEAMLASHMGRDDQHDITGVLEEPITAIIRDSFGNVILNLNPGGDAAVQNLSISNAETGGVIDLTATPQAGGDSNISINLGPQGTGTVQENGTSIALGVGEAAPSTAALTGDTKTWADLLTSILQNARILA